MKKIPTVFLRDPEDRAHVLDQVNPGCEWVLDGEGVATRKWDGTCVRLDDEGLWWARREVKPGKTPPSYFVPVETDEVTGKTQGWEPITQSAFVKFHAEAVSFDAFGHLRTDARRYEAGTYELVGPKINGNPEGFDRHVLIRHGQGPEAMRTAAEKAPRTFEELGLWLWSRDWEGLVFHHEDGRMAKIKRRDYFPGQA